MEIEPYMSQQACNVFDFPSELWALGQKQKQKRVKKRKGRRMLNRATSRYPRALGLACYLKPSPDTHELCHCHHFTHEEMES